MEWIKIPNGTMITNGENNLRAFCARVIIFIFIFTYNHFLFLFSVCFLLPFHDIYFSILVESARKQVFQYQVEDLAFKAEPKAFQLRPASIANKYPNLGSRWQTERQWFMMSKNLMVVRCIKCGRIIWLENKIEMNCSPVALFLSLGERNLSELEFVRILFLPFFHKIGYC